MSTHNRGGAPRAHAIGCALVLSACGMAPGDEPGNPFGGGNNTTGATPTTFEVGLRADDVSGVQRVNFALPLSAGALTDETAVRLLVDGVELPAARRALARYGDGSVRSVQLQVEVDVSTTDALTVELGEPGRDGLALVAVETTLTGSGSQVRPRVWALLPTSVLVASEIVGPVVARADVEGTPLDAWAEVCDYERWNTDAFLINASASRDVWLFDRVTAMYRGYAITGAASPLDSAYREAELYRAGMTIVDGRTTGLAVPSASTDLKYHYSQGLALHYLFTGDDRFREAAEAVSARVVGMWDPDYDGSDEFWTERHAGFALLAHEWAARVTDDQAIEIGARADAAVTAYLATQTANRFGLSDAQSDSDARCFAHTASAHAESYGGPGCSPWMSAIVADGLDAHARRVGGARAAEVRVSLGKLGRLLAREGRDATGRPLYWMGVGGGPDQVDDYDEHWGESAYVVALAWAATGRTDAALRQAADELVAGLAEHGEVGQVRSFNWQCRSAVMTPALLE